MHTSVMTGLLAALASLTSAAPTASCITSISNPSFSGGLAPWTKHGTHGFSVAAESPSDPCNNGYNCDSTVASLLPPTSDGTTKTKAIVRQALSNICQDEEYTFQFDYGFANEYAQGVSFAINLFGKTIFRNASVPRTMQTNSFSHTFTPSAHPSKNAIEVVVYNKDTTDIPPVYVSNMQLAPAS